MNETGLVLSGGGSRGSYQIGAYKALLDSDIKISAVVGTSIGAINGAYIAQGDFDKACNIWETLDYHRVFSETRGILMDVEPLRQLLNDTLSEKTIRNSPIHYGFTAFNLSKRKMEYRFIEDIPQGQLIDFIMASSNVPFFKRVIIDGNHYLDGGVYDPLPRKMIYDAGYRNIISIMIDINPYGASDHMQCDDLFEIRINHSESLGNFLSVNPALIKQNFDMGYYDTLRALNRCTGAHYYLLPKNYRNHPLARPFYKKDVRKLLLDPTSKSILTNNLSLRRLLVHMTLSKYWKTEYTMTWHELFVSFAELTGEIFAIPRYNALTLYELINKILDAAQNIETSENYQSYNHASLPKLILSNQTDFIKKEYAAVALLNNHPAAVPILPALLLAAPDIIIAALFLKVIRYRQDTIKRKKELK